VWLDVQRRGSADDEDVVRLGCEVCPHVAYTYFGWMSTPPTKVPAEGTLLGALNQAIDKSGQLHVVLSYIDKTTASLQKKGEVRFQPNTNDDLGRIILGRGN
jgi:hypothetical protein